MIDTMMPATRNRNPWIAGILSLGCPGTGCLYVGRARRGVITFLAYALVTPLVALTLVLAPPLPGRLLTLALLMPLSIPVFAALDAFLLARRGGIEYRARWYNDTFVYCLLLALGYFVTEMHIASIRALRDQMVQRTSMAFLHHSQDSKLLAKAV